MSVLDQRRTERERREAERSPTTGGGGGRQIMDTRWRQRVNRGLAFTALVILAVIWLLPLAWAIDTAIKPEAATTTVPVTWVPPRVTFESFREVIAAGDMVSWYVNSTVTSVIITAMTVVLASLAAYGFSRVPFRGRTIMFWVVIAGIMVPPQILIVPLFTEMISLGLVDTYWGIILPQVAMPVAVFILKSFFDGLPHELEEAAIVDGASRLRVFLQIWLPLSLPVLSAVAIYAFVTSWNNFLWPFVVITNPDLMTIPVGLATVQSSYGLRYAQIMASAVLGGMPLLVIFVFFQRQIIQGFATTGLKA